MLGMSTRPPTGSVTLAPTPASIMAATVAGSQTGPARMPSSPWRSASAMVSIVSAEPPEAVLLPWSASTTGKSPSALACAMVSCQRIGPVDELRATLPGHLRPVRRSAPAPRRGPPALASSPTMITLRPAQGMSASGKPPKTDAFMTSPAASISMARPMMSFIGWNIGECWFMCVSIGSQRCRVNGLASPFEHRHQRPRRPRAGLAHVDVRIGAVAGDDVGALDQRRAEVAVEVQRDRDRHLRCDLADPAQQLGFAVVVSLHHHRAVQVEHHRVAAPGHGGDDRVGHRVEGLPVGGRARRGIGVDRHVDLAAGVGRRFQEGGKGDVGAGIGVDGAPAGQHRAVGRVERGSPREEGRERCRHRREGIGFVQHACDDESTCHVAFGSED